MVSRRAYGVGLAIAAPLAAVALYTAPATATSIGACPTGSNWERVALADLGIDPDTASGIPSLDGNGDGFTCIHDLPNYPRFPDAFVFRDNTVGP